MDLERTTDSERIAQLMTRVTKLEGTLDALLDLVVMLSLMKAASEHTKQNMKTIGAELFPATGQEDA